MRFVQAGIIAIALALLPVWVTAVSATIIAPGYQDICRAEEHPKWAYGKEGTTVQLAPLFGCDQRFGARRDADERYVEQLQKRGVHSAQLSAVLVKQGWKWIGVRKLPVALNRFNLAFEADPRNGDVYHGIAVVMAETGQPAEVIDYWFAQGIAEEKGKAGRFADYGRFLNIHGRFSEALPVLQRALDLEPENAWTMMNLATLHFHQDDKAAGCAMIERIAGTAPPPGFDPDRFDRIIAGWTERADEEGCAGQNN